MGRIIVLQPHIANQIAAGEVVERPASVVKELVENAIDAGACAITVEIKNGGIDYIRVTDNGSGIRPEDCLLAFERHATSKITKAEDLQHIETLGFRGEALASIAAVAQVQLKTRTADHDAGILMRVEGGVCRANEPIGCPEGTTLEVQNLFYNVPARRKFLKAPRAEAGYVGEYLSQMILARPDISIKFIVNGKTQYHSPGDNQLKNAIYCIYGPEVLEHLKAVDYDDNYIKLSGYIGTAAIARPNRSQQSFLVNGRSIRSRLLSDALQMAYDTRLMSGKFPFAVIAVQISHFEVDVNVHPNKLEVRFSDEQRVERALYEAAQKALGYDQPATVNWSKIAAASPVSEETKTEKKEHTFQNNESSKASIQVPILFNAPCSAEEAQSMRLKEAEDNSDWNIAHLKQTVSNAANSVPIVQIRSSRSELQIQQKLELPEREQIQQEFGAIPFMIAGQVFDTYWIVQQGERIFFIDQHAAHERVLYERFINAEYTVASQQLLSAQVVTLSSTQMHIWEENKSHLSELGFETEAFGATTVRICAVPNILTDQSVQAAFHDILAMLQKHGKTTPALLKKEAIIQASCKHAVKGGDALTKHEIASLLEEYAKSGAPMTCPHGRPIMIQMTKRELEKLFKRIL